MRHWFFLIVFLLALGALRMVGCGDDRSCVEDEDCDDGNPCTIDDCYWYDPDAPVTCEVVSRCSYSQVTDGTPCGSGNVCVDGVCGENRCEDVVCDDDDACTDDECDYVDGTCHFPPVECYDDNMCTEEEATCDPVDGCIFTAVEDGSFCYPDLPLPTPGACKAGTCEALPTEACTNAEDLELVCDPSFEDEVQACAIRRPDRAAPCLVENTGISVDCASCYGALVHCVFENCFDACVAGADPQECDACKGGYGCDTPDTDCTGDLESACP